MRQTPKERYGGEGEYEIVETTEREVEVGTKEDSHPSIQRDDLVRRCRGTSKTGGGEDSTATTPPTVLGYLVGSTCSRWER